MPVIILVADGVRPDTLSAAMDSGAVPHLARLRSDGGLHTVATTWPSVTGVAYTPFLMGRYPGQVGLSGLRWFDRSRRVGAHVGHTRSYVGLGMRHIDRDLAADAPTLFELTDSSLGALSVIGRGLRHEDRLGRGARFVARAALTHFRGSVRGWLDIDRDIGAAVVRRVRRDAPAFVFAAFTGIDKASHAAGHGSALVHEALSQLDDVVAELRHDAERSGRWDKTHLWIVSDHGHSAVTGHDDLAVRFRNAWGYRTLAHPWTLGHGHEVAVMVSGNAMAHVYVELEQRTRPFWPALRARWEAVADALLARPSVDLLVLPHADDAVEVRSARRGIAMIRRRGGRYSYQPLDGDPLGIGPMDWAGSRDAFDVTAASDYPDAVVQIAQLAAAARSGDLVVSAAPGWDFRSRYEPIKHCSSHGGLHRDHMLVPMLVNQPVRQPPRRTVDVMPSALVALGLPVPPGLDGRSFVSESASLALSGVS
ncbi:MAG: alkaline phosphatase family protein [Gemmatimonadaceae bacterium]|nr:alkaline phosphatase family protein [Gemmatimonadaceae bacterium]